MKYFVFSRFFVVLVGSIAFGFVLSSNASQAGTTAPQPAVEASKSDSGVGSDRSKNASSNDDGSRCANSNSNDLVKTVKFDPLKRNAQGVQTLYPAVAKIIGRGRAEENKDGERAIPLFYGTGVYVAEYGEFGIVVTNWHVVSESTESIDVVFPSFSSSARVLLRDETWDLAALVVRKPLDVSPIPISLEYPRLSETLWTAGYGQSAGIEEFQIQSGRLLNYAAIVDPTDLSEEPQNDAKDSDSSVKSARSSPALADVRKPRKADRADENQKVSISSREKTIASEKSIFETLAIGNGVRHGDSGGPIFNRYGELSGIVWGSDGAVTMGTFCLRIQIFLTQAFERLAILRAENSLNPIRSDLADDFLRWNVDDRYSKSSPMKTTISFARKKFCKNGAFSRLLRRRFTFPLTDRCDAETLRKMEKEQAIRQVETDAANAGKNEATALPPSPPVFSPTFVVQQREMNSSRPDVADADFVAKLNDRAVALVLNDRFQPNVEIAETALTGAREISTSESKTTQGLTQSASKPDESSLSSDRPVFLRPVSSQENSDDARNAVGDSQQNEGKNAISSNDGDVEKKKEGEGDSSKKIADEYRRNNNKNVKDVDEKETSLNNPRKSNFSDWQIYAIICFLFFLFYYSGRLFIRSEKKEALRKIQKEREKQKNNGAKY